MISYRREFVFIHIPKTGGKSVRKALRPYTLSPRQRLVQYVATRTNKTDVYGIDIGGSHARAREWRDILGEVTWSEYFTFAFVRNPWARMVSEYHFVRKRPNSVYYKVATEGSLEDFVRYRHAEGVDQQIDYLRDADGQRIVDFVGQVESFDADFARVCTHLRVNPTLPHKNRTRHRDYREEMSPVARDLVAELYADDIAEFGYRFDA